MKKIAIIVLLVIISSTATFFIWRSVSYGKDESTHKSFLLPSLELSVIEITSLTSNKTEVVLKILVKNQLPFTFKSDSMAYQIEMNGIEILKDQYRKPIVLRSNDTSWVSLPITLWEENINEILRARKQHGDSVDIHLQMTFFTNLFFKKKFTFDINRTVPFIKIPEVNMRHLSIDSLNFERASVELAIDIINQNSFAIKVKNVTYTFAIEDNEWMAGSIPDHIELAALDTTLLEIPMRISLKEVSKTLFDLLSKGKNVEYKLNIDLRMESENEMTKNSKVIIESSGTVKSLLKSIKK